MSSPNKVTRLWEGVGMGVLVEVARDEWKQERIVALMWLWWPKHLNPLLSLSDSPVALGCLASKDVPTHECVPSTERIEELNHPLWTSILGTSLPGCPFPFLGTASRGHIRDPRGPGITLYSDEMFGKDILRFGRRDSKAQPKDVAWHCAGAVLHT